jgi:hypothetical protein
VITKDDFRDWQSNPVTKAVFAGINQRIYQLQQELGLKAGIDIRNDGMSVGAIQAMEDILNTEFEEEMNND